MLPAARVEQVKLQPLSADARLAAAIERGTRIAATKIKLFDPNQPRDELGKWTGGGGSYPFQIADKIDGCIDQCLHHLDGPKNGWSTDIRDNKYWKCINECMKTS